ncbi:hypothetical protein J2Z69_000511 [Paenibacillus shirakamiensis]|uniref:DNA-binding protein n=1 Tax=Paenibacillus shirakamiensis TaxID=1265935 RepID=A0ABS4JCP7_9BACL|nr:hypothetical protein [Paenibacillus shirakamiensis]MBP1999492.1 hypothetical protein [Paenibacillus shirakamiensis]
MLLSSYRAKARELGGEACRVINQLLDELEKEREITSGKKLPPLLGSKEVAERIEIDPKNLHHTRKTKFFPEPNTCVGKRPLWAEETINQYLDKLSEWRDKKNN